MHGAHPRASCIAPSSALMTRKRPTSKTCASMTSPLRLEAAVAIAHEPSHVILDSIAHPIRQDRVGGSRFLRASISAEDEPTPRKTIRACGDGGPICARSHLGRLLGVFCRLHFCEFVRCPRKPDNSRFSVALFELRYVVRYRFCLLACSPLSLPVLPVIDSSRVVRLTPIQP